MAKNIQNCTTQGSNKRLLTHQSPIFANCTACTCFKCCYSVFTYLALPPPVRPAGGVEGCKRQSQPVDRPGGAGGGESSKRASPIASYAGRRHRGPGPWRSNATRHQRPRTCRGTRAAMSGRRRLGAGARTHKALQRTRREPRAAGVGRRRAGRSAARFRSGPSHADVGAADCASVSEWMRAGRRFLNRSAGGRVTDLVLGNRVTRNRVVAHRATQAGSGRRSGRVVDRVVDRAVDRVVAQSASGLGRPPHF